MKKLVSSQAANRKPSATTPRPINNANTHFIQTGISNLTLTKSWRREAACTT
jgi:hypothetical protein